MKAFPQLSIFILMLMIKTSILNAQTCSTNELDKRADAYLKKIAHEKSMAELMSGTVADLRKQEPEVYKKLPDENVKRIKITDKQIGLNIVSADKTVDAMAIIRFHGGGFIRPLLPWMENEALMLAQRFNAVVFDVDYRVAPEHPFPAAKDDAYAAYLWVRENAKSHGADPEKIILLGEGSGGTLVALTMHKAKKESKHEAIKSVIMICPITDNPLISFYTSYEDNAKGYGLSKDESVYQVQQYLDKSIWFASSGDVWPIYENELLGMPPSLIITTEFDVLRDEGIAYGKKLERAGNRSAIKCFPHQLHAFAGLPENAEERKRVYELIDEIIQFGLSR
ncbi:MAG TPA: alpha/beta hydrolase [Cyclobacteriaceae bacterium]|nr:alpha/beta hydrolase [Cyclobacteriaceae bacterium]